MKALSVRQPWANMIASGEKTIETRLWTTSYRGELLIVASKFPSIPPAGAAVAIVDLVDCRPMTENDVMAACCDAYAGAFAWVFGRIRSIRPFEVVGQRRLFDVDVPLVALAEWKRK